MINDTFYGCTKAVGGEEIRQSVKKWQRIIVIDPLYLGDLMFATPFIRELRKNFPGARIDLIVNSTFHSIMEANPNLDNVYAYNKKWAPKLSVEFARELSRNNYDLGVNIHGSWRTALLLRLINPSYTIGYGGKGRGLFLNRELKQTENQHLVDVYLNFLRELDLNVEASLPYLEVKEAARYEIDKKLKNWGIDTEKN